MSAAASRPSPPSVAHYGARDIAASALTPRELVLVNAIAERVSELLRDKPTHARLVDAATIADALGVSRDCVYAHADELGGERIGGGPRGRLFDLDQALAAWTSRSTSNESQTPQTPVAVGDSSRRGHRRLDSSAELLPIRAPADPLDAGRRRS